MATTIPGLHERLGSDALGKGAKIVQVQALRSVEQYLGLEKLYILGTNCVDNGPKQGLSAFLSAASKSPSTVLHYEFMQVIHPMTKLHHPYSLALR